MRKFKLTDIITLGIVFIFLSACATPMLEPAEKDTAPMKSTINEIEEFETELETAKQNQLGILSPGWFAKAEASFERAKTKAEKGTALTDIREDITDARGYLKNAEETAKVARTLLPAVIESRRLAIDAGAPQSVEAYGRVEDQFLKLTEAIEKNNINYTKKNAPKVSQAYRDLELMAIKNNTIGEARKVIAQAEAEKAEKYAPQAFELAQRHLQETEDFIDKNRYAATEIQQKADKTVFFGNRARVVTDQGKKLENMKPEETYVWAEDMLKQITAKLAAKDARDQKIDLQIENILNSIGGLQADYKADTTQLTTQLTSTKKNLAETRASYDAQIQSLNQALAAIQSKTIQDQKTKELILAEQKTTARKLEEERRFNQKFIEIQNYFRSSEAEVYKKGNQLIVRLKGMQFPVGQAVIMPENYQLLSKVQRAIGNFEGSSVIIEGHTDSTGSQEVNAILSQQRADAVKDYLVANNTLSANKIRAKGYGSERPLASNATTEGRAANRRIDVLVTPRLQPGE